jgi:hypothetical protein
MYRHGLRNSSLPLNLSFSMSFPRLCLRQRQLRNEDQDERVCFPFLTGFPGVLTSAILEFRSSSILPAVPPVREADWKSGGKSCQNEGDKGVVLGLRLCPSCTSDRQCPVPVSASFVNGVPLC